MAIQSVASSLFFSALLLADANAFGVRHITERPATSLNLLPDQGSQLVAAYNALSESQRTEMARAPISVEKEVEARAVPGSTEESEKPHRTWGAGTISASKSLLSRIFQGPSVKHPLEHKDVCYYPMVGFRFIKGVNAALPTKSTASCAMPTKSQKEEEVYGWYSSSCKLDLFSEDVCHNPIN
ncbi:unnamed protein product [Pseudo-nitzschia multistriata]|uniref:Uncharacterized protein n=1 Tax=Pseudo-nitzschia multistriata TaxID=183589 RepID=A0A448Z6Y3_9STRA|nr:unnamed protein product [Pseudo-nitzschia multistriata]VEU37778.1 unnamed protein product [Pseudo-nitzschia multistriata]